VNLWMIALEITLFTNLTLNSLIQRLRGSYNLVLRVFLSQVLYSINELITLSKI